MIAKATSIAERPPKAARKTLMTTSTAAARTAPANPPPSTSPATLDKLDDPLIPTSGYAVKLSNEVTAPL